MRSILYLLTTSRRSPRRGRAFAWGLLSFVDNARVTWSLSRLRPRLLVIALEEESLPEQDLSFWRQALSPSPQGVPAAHRQTIADYWEQCTYGEIRMTHGHTIRLRLRFDDQDWTAVRSNRDLGTEQSAAARRLMQRALRGGRGFALSVSGPYLCVLISSLPVAREFAVPGFTKHPWPVAVLASQSAHTTFTHEIGHLLGFAHPWGLTGGHRDTRTGEYGSPYCVMGTASRQYEVCRHLDRWPGTHGPIPDSNFWSAAGPRVSHASFLATRTLLRPRPATEVQAAPRGQETRDVTLTDPGGPAAVPRGVLLRYTDHDLCLEVRRPRPGRTDFMDWDARLDLRRTGTGTLPPDRDLHDGPGVVVHRIDQVPGSRGWRFGIATRPRRVTYLGSIPLPPSGTRDLHLPSGAHLTVISDDGDRVLVRVSDGPVSPRTEICSLYPADRRDRGAIRPWIVQLHGHAYGGNGHRLTWEVGDLPLRDLGPGQMVVKHLPLPVVSHEPLGGTPGLIQITATWDQITLRIDPCAVAFDLPIRLTSTGNDRARSEHVIHVPPSRRA